MKHILTSVDHLSDLENIAHSHTNSVSQFVIISRRLHLNSSYAILVLHLGFTASLSNWGQTSVTFCLI